MDIWSCRRTKGAHALSFSVLLLVAPPPHPTESQQSLQMCESKMGPFRENVDEQNLQGVLKDVIVERKHKIVHDKRLEKKQLFQIMLSMLQNHSKSLDEDTRAIFFQLCNQPFCPTEHCMSSHIRFARHPSQAKIIFYISSPCLKQNPTNQRRSNK